MRTARRVCLKDHSFDVGDGTTFDIKRGQEYLTTLQEDGKVTLLSSYWICDVPVDWFGGAEPGPGEAWDRNDDIQTAIRIYQEYARKTHGSEVNSPFTKWCKQQCEIANADPDGENRRVQQLEINMKFLLQCTDTICYNLRPDFIGTWQQRAEAACEASKQITLEREKSS